MSVQYVSDEAGNRTGVLVPIGQWERFAAWERAQPQPQPKPTTKPIAAASLKKATPARLSKKEQFKEDFREAVRDMQAGKGRPIRELLAELDELANQVA